MKKPKKAKSLQKKHQPQVPPVPKPPVPPKSKIGSFLKSGLARTIAVATILVTVLALYDAWYDTTPEISAAQPDASSPFLLPFAVRNPSHIFWMNDVEWTCGIDSLITPEGGGISNLGIRSGGEQEIAPGKTEYFRCPIGISAANTTGVKIFPSVTYKTLLFSRASEEMPCTWQTNAVPQRWVCGEIR